jgi:aryl-alcohol dehydrogenase-like predicted oxidoreductase
MAANDHTAGPVLGVQRLATTGPAERDGVLARAIASGWRWVDCADVYGSLAGDAERWLRPFVGQVRIATKGGLVRRGPRWEVDGHPRSLESAAEASRERLGVDSLDLWSWHAPDPRVELRRSLSGIARIRDRGIAREVGLCNVTVGALRAALDHFPVAVLQVELSPLRPASLWSGVVEEALTRGVTVWAYRPFGGVEGAKHLLREPRWLEQARRFQTTPAALVVRWLVDLGVVPIPGPTTVAHLDECLTGAQSPLDGGARLELDAVSPVGRLRVPRSDRAVRIGSEAEVVLIMGSPGSGKSTRAGAYPGYLRLNRDERGGTLSSLVPLLEEALENGQRRVVLDNTYASRASRGEVLEAAWRRGVPVRCEWLDIDPDDAEVNAVRRLLERMGRLPEPDELQRGGRRDPALVPPRALHRYRSDLEPPELEEGFLRIDRLPFVRRPSAADGRALLLDPRDLTPQNADRIGALIGEGFQVAVLGWGDRTAAEPVLAQAPFPIATWWCSHPAGPPRCWCRKPLPGLGLLALDALRASPARSLAFGTSVADRALARKLGVPVVTGLN